MKENRIAICVVVTVAIVLGSLLPASAAITEAAWLHGKGRAPSYVYNVAKGPIYGNSMPGWPGSKQWAAVENGYPKRMWLAMEIRGVSGGRAVCLGSGRIHWMDSSVVRAWIPTTPVDSLGTCSRHGDTRRVD
jgi:hypothetical protein